MQFNNINVELLNQENLILDILSYLIFKVMDTKLMECRLVNSVL